MLARQTAVPTENVGRPYFENGIFDSQHLLKKLFQAVKAFFLQ